MSILGLSNPLVCQKLQYDLINKPNNFIPDVAETSYLEKDHRATDLLQFDLMALISHICSIALAQASIQLGNGRNGKSLDKLLLFC